MYESWMNFPKKEMLTKCFQILSRCPSDSDFEKCLPIIAEYVSFAYSKKIVDLNELRFNLFVNYCNNTLRDLPPANSSLMLHVRRSAFQSGWVWGNTLTQVPTPPLVEWGWVLLETLYFRWVMQQSPPDVQRVCSTCNCRTARCKGCRCAKNLLACLSFCLCKRNCCI